MKEILLKIPRKVKDSFLWIWEQEGTPGERARGIAVGVFSGCFPFFGLQSLIGVVLATLLKGNRLLAVASTWISNPLTYLPLYWFNYKVGALILGSENYIFDLKTTTSKEMWDHGWIITSRILFGSSITGLFFGFLFGYSSYLAFRFSNKKRF